MTAAEIKRAIFSQYDYAFRACFACDEFLNMDVMLLRSSGEMLELEIKISIADLKQDIKKLKWCTNRQLYYCEMNSSFANWCIPNFFAFVVPSDILKQAKQVIKEMYPEAGLWEYNNGVFKNVIKSKRLHSKTATLKTYNYLLKSLFYRYQKLFTKLTPEKV